MATDLWKVSTICGDITEKEDVQRLIQKAVEQFGRIDILANNAGTFLGSPLLATSGEQGEIVLKVNLHGVFPLTRYVIPHMLKACTGIIGNISSVLASVEV